MNIETYRDFCLSQPKATESFPFDDKTIVFKLMEKIFTLASILPFESLNVKCEPSKAVTLRACYASVVPGYHMNKKHWNTLYINRELTDDQIFGWIKDSYDLILKNLPRKLQNELVALNIKK